MPVSRSKEIVEGTYPGHVQKPDVDNLLKFTMDAITGPMVEDDKTVSTVTASKMFGPKAYTKVTIQKTFAGGRSFP